MVGKNQVDPAGVGFVEENQTRLSIVGKGREGKGFHKAFPVHHHNFVDIVGEDYALLALGAELQPQLCDLLAV